MTKWAAGWQRSKTSPDGIPQEIWDLAIHHEDIIEREFPYVREARTSAMGDYNTSLVCEDGFAPEVWLQVETWGEHPNPKSEHSVILQAGFCSDSIKIAVHASTFPDNYEEISYADPRFTDDIIVDKLKKISALNPIIHGYDVG